MAALFRTGLYRYDNQPIIPPELRKEARRLRSFTCMNSRFSSRNLTLLRLPMPRAVGH